MSTFYFSKPYQPPEAPNSLPINLPWALFGGRSPKDFMREYWHKKPLLVKKAIPAFDMASTNGQVLGSPISHEELFAMANDADEQNRIIKSKPWGYCNGPFKKKDIPSIHSPNWTLLLQGMEARHSSAAKVLSWFRFIPDARLDDLMISVAGPGGGVGPHFDSYDVFLIQMSGRRLWRISEQADLSLNPKLPLKILKNFQPEQEWVLEPGDMLYLPPHVAHDGISLDAGCQTWSVGFRATSYKELLQEGLWHLAEMLEGMPELEKHYADPMQKAIRQPENLPNELILQLENHLKKLKLNTGKLLLPGIAAYLTEPKPQAFFTGPEKPLTLAQFNKTIQKLHLIRHPKTRILRLKREIFCNGENMTKNQPKNIQIAWQALASKKPLQNLLNPSNLPKNELNSSNSLYEAYLSGWLVFE